MAFTSLQYKGFSRICWVQNVKTVHIDYWVEKAETEFILMMMFCILTARSAYEMLVLSKDDHPRKTYAYRLDIPVAARWTSLIVAPFKNFPDRQNALLSNICLLCNLAKLRSTVVGFFHSAFSIFSSQVVFDEKVLDQTIDTRVKLAFALARQWFGLYITFEAPSDGWLLDGLAGFRTDTFIKRFLGKK
ncbi:hypothetical protein M9H77_17462 [Catharanthus roseus]|uniref:Uncharacterized protein n=1 Tax=Catharanthus roseus TaxID=4058 RepID=A0ACC0B4N6_CATRO|nr:hypothetical protein M9H77_17462 [Catharanthus roseus]